MYGHVNFAGIKHGHWNEILFCLLYILIQVVRRQKNQRRFLKMVHEMLDVVKSCVSPFSQSGPIITEGFSLPRTPSVIPFHCLLDFTISCAFGFRLTIRLSTLAKVYFILETTQDSKNRTSSQAAQNTSPSVTLCCAHSVHSLWHLSLRGYDVSFGVFKVLLPS